MGVSSIKAGALALLDAEVAALTALGVDVPDLVRILPGAAVAWDGPMLAVNYSQTEAGIPGRADSAYTLPAATMRMVRYGVTLLRVVSGIQDAVVAFGQPGLPTTAQLTADAELVMDDAEALYEATLSIFVNYVLLDPGEAFVIQAATSVGPEGSLAGNRIFVDVVLG